MINLYNSKSNSLAEKHYKGVKFYVNQVLDFYINFFAILCNKLKTEEAKEILYTNSDLPSQTITSLAQGVCFDKDNKEKATKKFLIAHVYDAFEHPDIYIREEFRSNPKDWFSYFTALKEKLEDIIMGEPKDLVKIDSDLSTEFPFTKIAEDKETAGDKKYVEELRKILLHKIFNYGKFSKHESKGLDCDKGKKEYWDRYKLCKILNVNTCAYCNRLYTFTIFDRKGKGVISPSLDHFFDKATSPLFALSFFNLIPSCTNCNSSLKGSKNFMLKSHFHPYMGGFSDKAVFSYEPSTHAGADGISDELRVTIKAKEGKNKSRINQNIKDFKLEVIYTQHADYVQELLRKKKISSDRYLDILRTDTFPDLDLSLEEAYRLAFNNYYKEEDFQKRPLAKMTKDIAEELGMI